MSQAARPMGLKEWGMLIGLSIIWGGSFFFFALALRELPTFTIVPLRVGIATIALWLIVALLRLPVPRDSATWRNFFIMGLLNNIIPFSLIIWGQHQVAPGFASILNATTPFFTVLVANALTSDERLTWNKLTGAIVGLIGVASMMGLDALAAMSGAFLAQLAIVCAPISYAFGGVFGKRFANLPALVTAAGQTTGSSILLLPVVAILDRPWTLPFPSLTVVAAILALALLCTSFAYVLFFTILKRAGATNLALVTFLVPVSAMLLGILFLNEVLGWQHLLGMAAIGVGLALIDGRLTRRFAAPA